MELVIVGLVLVIGLVFYLRKRNPRDDPDDMAAWEIGPVIRGRNYSVGSDLHPGAGFTIPIPVSPGHINYVTFRHGSLAGKSRITMRFQVDHGDNVRLHPTNFTEAPATLTLYFQRRNDDWSARGSYETYRWYATSATVALVNGAYEVTVSFSDLWTAVETSTSLTAPTAFRTAINDADRVGFVLGGGDGVGHGIYATGPARIIVTDFRIE